MNGPQKQITTLVIDLTATIVEEERTDTIADAVVEDLLHLAHALLEDLIVATTIQIAIMNVVAVRVDRDIVVVTIDPTMEVIANIIEETVEM